MSNTDEETIRERAYFLWLNDGRPDDRHIDHWLQAAGEMEVADAPAPEVPVRAEAAG